MSLGHLVFLLSEIIVRDLGFVIADCVTDDGTAQSLHSRAGISSDSGNHLMICLPLPNAECAGGNGFILVGRIALLHDAGLWQRACGAGSRSARVLRGCGLAAAGQSTQCWLALKERTMGWCRGLYRAFAAAVSAWAAANAASAAAAASRRRRASCKQ